MSLPESGAGERRIIWIAALLQFVNITDFMMVMPLGPDFARALSIPLNQVGLIGGIYTLAAAIAGLVAAQFIDHFPRRRALLWMLSGLVLATAAGALAWNFASMLGVRLLAGVFGGPLSSLTIALVADWVPPQRRGAAMGKVMGSFAAASVLGVPFGLELSARLSWHAPFLVTALIGVAVWVFAWRTLPHSPAPDTRHGSHFLSMFKREYLLAYLAVALATAGGFMIIPNVSAHIQDNLHFPRAYIGLLYLIGGGCSFFSMRWIGSLSDRRGASETILLLTTVLSVAIITGFIRFPSLLPVPAIFTLFMISMSGRMVVIQSLSSKLPALEERGAFMTTQSSVMHLASALGALSASLILDSSGEKLLHVPTVGAISLCLALILPLVVAAIESRPSPQPA